VLLFFPHPFHTEQWFSSRSHRLPTARCTTWKFALRFRNPTQWLPGYGQGILDFTNSIIDNAKIGFRKKLYSTIPSNGKPRVIRFADGIEEADYIVDRILEILDNSLDLNNFAVLTRASWQSTYVQAELMRRQLPFVVVGGFKFSERRHVKDIVAFLKLTLNNLDAIAWHRILKLVNGIGKVRASEIVTHIHARAG
jgi:DNA helicase-2/ATP-dependent DNA helicase PcrA